MSRSSSNSRTRARNAAFCSSIDPAVPGAAVAVGNGRSRGRRLVLGWRIHQPNRSRRSGTAAGYPITASHGTQSNATTTLDIERKRLIGECRYGCLVAATCLAFCWIFGCGNVRRRRRRRRGSRSGAGSVDSGVASAAVGPPNAITTLGRSSAEALSALTAGRGLQGVLDALATKPHSGLVR